MKSLHLGTLDCGDGLDRRDFLKVASLVSLGLLSGCAIVDDAYDNRPVYYPSNYPSPTPTAPGPPTTAYIDPRVARWRERVKTFVYVVLPTEWADYYAGRIAYAGVEVWSYNSFHGQFSSPYAFSEQLPPCATRYGTTFELAGLPYFDSQRPARRTKDLNEIEITRLIDPDEVRYYGCVLSPCSERRPPTSDDYAKFSRTVQTYGGEPRAYNLDYVRNVSDGRTDHGQLHAYGVTGRVNNPDGSPRKNLFLSSFDVS